MILPIDTRYTNWQEAHQVSKGKTNEHITLTYNLVLQELNRILPPMQTSILLADQDTIIVVARNPDTRYIHAWRCTSIMSAATNREAHLTSTMLAGRGETDTP
jgi:hypothetical protein